MLLMSDVKSFELVKEHEGDLYNMWQALSDTFEPQTGISLQQPLKKGGMKIQFEFTAPDMPQQNGIVECAFPTKMGHTRAMMNYAGFDKNMQQLMWCEAVQTQPQD